MLFLIEHVRVVAASLLLLPGIILHAADNNGTLDRGGKQIYDYYCYQCHGYSGNANTLASTFLEPKPRDFTTTSRTELPRNAMIEAVTKGKSGTAMMPFTSVMSVNEIESVVDYIRDSFMGEARHKQNYHTEANGWPNHDRYALAFPYVRGEIALDTPGEQLTKDNRAGKRLYLGACISCHDQPLNTSEVIWESRAVSYPRRHYSHKLDNIDAVSGATRLYSLHEVPVPDEGLNEIQKQGRQLFLDNCAFCHAPDGTGKNWIGSFLDRKPRNFTVGDFMQQISDEQLAMIIREGVPGTSMPAWKSVLNDDEIESLVSFLKHVFGEQLTTTQ